MVPVIGEDWLARRHAFRDALIPVRLSIKGRDSVDVQNQDGGSGRSGWEAGTQGLVFLQLVDSRQFIS